MAKPGSAIDPNGRVQSTLDQTHRSTGAGVGVISGTTKVAGVATACRAYLYFQDGTFVSYRRTAANGTYTFSGLTSNAYRLVIEQEGQAHRSKVEHVVVA